MLKIECPICKSGEVKSLLEANVPILQNRVYDNEIEAKNCNSGVINLTHCAACNFTFNASFDENIIVYDENYDNSVPSELFINYYKTICEYIYKKYSLENGIIYDVGCGKGTFLKMLCQMYPNVQGVGIDPSYEGNLTPLNNLTFIQDFFKHEQVTRKPDLVISRHVFEHIEFPKEFLAIIREPIKTFENVPLFIEVPDFAWIVENKTFWDLCYEHCNYFSETAIENMFDNKTCKLSSITKSFGNQYLWVEGFFNATDVAINNVPFYKISKDDISVFINSIVNSKQTIRNIINAKKQENYKIIVWGMATKGVIFTNNIDADKTLVDYCIDINKEKQNKFTPITAHLLVAPNILETLMGNKCLVIIMNTNYTDEIKSTVKAFGLECAFIDAHGLSI